jgi:hypothetical protein
MAAFNDQLNAATKKALLFFSLLQFLASFGRIVAQETEHYPNGSEGIKGASLPPPGFYWRSYNVWYHASALKDKDGNEINVGFAVNVLATVQRLIWVTDKKILGGSYGISVIIPLVNTHLQIRAAGVDDNETGIGDIVIDQILRWQEPLFDVGSGLAVFLPTGKWDKSKPALPGRNYFTLMPTLGMTYYWDEGKTWATSVLTRYEYHNKKTNEDITPGTDFHFEWGLSKNIAQVWDAGIVGYCQWQITDDNGSAAVNPSVHDRVFTVGPEVSYFHVPAKLNISLRYESEFGARDRAEGGTGVLTLTKVF